MIIQNSLFLNQRIGTAIQRIVENELLIKTKSQEKIILAFSGGKDSIVCHKLCEMAGINFEVQFNITTVDPPELIYFIRENYPHCVFIRPKYTMSQLIEKEKFPPTRLMRYCCDYLKKNSSKNKVIITGVRRQESIIRKDRPLVNYCYKNNSVQINPIIDWTEQEVWEFISYFDLKYPALYDKGYKRIGCIGCPSSSRKKRIKELKDYPKYKQLYLRAFDKMLIRREESTKKGKIYKNKWKSSEEVMNWWLSR